MFQGGLMKKSEFEKLKSALGLDFKIFNKGDILFYKWNNEMILCIDKQNKNPNKRYCYINSKQVAEEYDIII